MVLQNAKYTLTLLALLSVAVSHIQAGKTYTAMVLVTFSGAVYGGWKLYSLQTQQNLKINALEESVAKLTAVQKTTPPVVQTLPAAGAAAAGPLLDTEYVKVESFHQLTQQALQANRTALLNLGRAFNGKFSADQQLQEAELTALVTPLQTIETRVLQLAAASGDKGGGRCNVA